MGGRTARGFTLVELLVVIAIIALLISILLPSLNRAREQGRATVCMSNMRGLMMSVHMYADDNDGRFPTGGLYHGGQTNEEELSWVVQLSSLYGKGSEIVRCPSDRSRYWDEPLPPPDGRYRQTSYASSYYFAAVEAVAGGDPYDRWERVPRPEVTIFWAELIEEPEEDIGYAAADHVHPEGWWGNPLKNAQGQLELEQHLGRANYALMDAHVERLTFEQTYAIDPFGGFPPKFVVNRWNPDLAR